MPAAPAPSNHVTQRRNACSSFVVLSFLLMTSPAYSQDVDALRREIEAMRQQLKMLSDRLQQLESPAPPTASAPAPAPAAPAPTLADLARPRQPFALAQPGRSLLFDIGVSGDFVADFTSSAHERRQDGTFAGRENRLFVREAELGLFGRVDPYASAVVRLSVGEEPTQGGDSARELTVRLDEANATLLTLPFGTTARFGLMRPRFGTLNIVHQDDLPQVDRPNVLSRFFGEEELDGESGIEAFWVLPASIYHELSLGVFDGDNETAFGLGSLRDPLVVGRWRTFFEFEERAGLQLDLSAASGMARGSHRNTVVGLGAKYKWIGAGSGFPVLTLAAEALGGFRTVDTEESGQAHVERWGAYAYAQYDFDRRWAAGLRGDWTELPVERGREWALCSCGSECSTSTPRVDRPSSARPTRCSCRAPSSSARIPRRGFDHAKGDPSCAHRHAGGAVTGAGAITAPRACHAARSLGHHARDRRRSRPGAGGDAAGTEPARHGDPAEPDSVGEAGRDPRS
jgi:hypothetical protein